jgi:hypothetical protein
MDIHISLPQTTRGPDPEAARMAYQQNLLNRFFDWISEGRSQATFVALHNKSYPHNQLSIGTLRRYINESPTGLRDFTQAKQFNADSQVDEITDIADAAKTILGATLAAQRIKARQWKAARYHAAAYGEKVTTEHSMKPGSTPLVEVVISAVPRGGYIEKPEKEENV